MGPIIYTSMEITRFSSPNSHFSEEACHLTVLEMSFYEKSHIYTSSCLQ